MTEMDKALALVPIASATATAVQSGPWSAPATWGGTLPGLDARVHIPPSVIVTFDAQTPRLRWLRVDGTFRLDPNARTLLNVDTWVSTDSSTVTLDNSTGTGSFQCVFPTGPRDSAADPFALGRGFLPMGTLAIKGRESPAYVWSAGALAGATQITLEADPVGWQVGDQLIIPGQGKVDVRYWHSTLVNDDDIVTITAIAGRTITFTPALVHDHARNATPLPWDSAQITRPIAVGNRSMCSVDFASASSLIPERGHVMAMTMMHPCSIECASFRDLGRTDKSLPVSDPDGTGNGLVNPRGRYPFHFHKCGVDPHGMEQMVRAVRVIGSPGWGLVNHSSNVCVDDSHVHGVYGCSYVCEAGDEVGCFCGNVSTRNTAPIGSKSVQVIADGRNNSDWLSDGIGFGTMGGPVRFEGRNIAYGAPFAGHATLGLPFQMPGEDATVVLRQNLPDPSITTLATMRPADVPQNHAGRDTFASAYGHVPWALNQNGAAPPAVGHSTFSKSVSETQSSGLTLGYLASVVIEDYLILAINSDWSADFGISHTGVNGDMQYRRITIGRFAVGLVAPTCLDNRIDTLRHDALTGILVQNPHVAPRLLTMASITGTRPLQAELATVDVGNYVLGYFKLQNGWDQFGPFTGPRRQIDVMLFPDHGSEPVYDNPAAWPLLTTKPCVSYLPEADTVTLDGHPCLFHEQGPAFPLAKLGTTVPAQFQGLTVAQLTAQTGLKIGGRTAAASATDMDGVYALVVGTGPPPSPPPPPPPAKTVLSGLTATTNSMPVSAGAKGVRVLANAPLAAIGLEGFDGAQWHLLGWELGPSISRTWDVAATPKRVRVLTDSPASAPVSVTVTEL